MQLSATLAWLVDAAGDMPGADRLLAELGAHLVADGLPLAGGALTLAVPHPLIARRTWLWRAGRTRGSAGSKPIERRRSALARRNRRRPRARRRCRAETGRALAQLDWAASVHG
jgi:hypothetical protein